jgi:hypothetical protein
MRPQRSSSNSGDRPGSTLRAPGGCPPARLHEIGYEAGIGTGDGGLGVEDASTLLKTSEVHSIVLVASMLAASGLSWRVAGAGRDVVHSGAARSCAAAKWVWPSPDHPQRGI